MNSLVATAAVTEATACSFSLVQQKPLVSRCALEPTASHAVSISRQQMHVARRMSVRAAAGQRSAEVVSDTGSSSSRETEEKRQQLTMLGGVMTDETVPEGHKGLHGFLYGDGGADVHDVKSDAAFTPVPGEDDGSSILSFSNYLAGRENKRFAGIYSVYDGEGAVQYVGYSRNVILSLKAHLAQVGEARCSGVRVKAYTVPAMVTRANLEAERALWLQDLGDQKPPGNAAESGLWEVKGVASVGSKVMTEAERAEYEEKKLKMRKAMGENLYDDVEGESADSKERRLRLLQAVEGDDWSAVIQNQTTETLPSLQPPAAAAAAAANNSSAAAEASSTAQAATPAAAASAAGIVSPFARGNVGKLAANEGQAAVQMTLAAVDKALDTVRPYLIADGGNVEVVEVTSGIVFVRLQGACGTCPSSTATLKMGIERALQETFGSQLKGVQQVDAYDASATVAAVDAHLDMLRPAINNFGGKVEVASVVKENGGVCEVKYQGPPAVGMGIQAAIKDKFPDIRTVTLLSF